ncbi:MAG TPA: hypothetical protein VFA11_09540 [Acidimicrobiales bacterium]|nr:hypothetical protein [Acidimicrobiales bacterium]
MTADQGSEPAIRATFLGPGGRPVKLTARTWRHITLRHPEVAPMLDHVRRAIEHPTDALPGREAGEQWLYLRVSSAPAPWLKVVVRYEAQGGGWVATAFLRRSKP